MNRSVVTLACAALLLPLAAKGATVIYNFTVPPSGTLPAGSFGNFSVQKFDLNLGTLTSIDSSVVLTSVGGRARFDSHAALLGTVTLTVGTALTSLDFPGATLDLSTVATSSSGIQNLGVDEAPAGVADPGGTPDFTGTDAASFSPASSVTNSDSGSTSNPADFFPYQAPGGGTFTVDYISSGAVGAVADVDGLADFDQAQWSATGFVRYNYDPIPEPSTALLLLGGGLAMFRSRRRSA